MISVAPLMMLKDFRFRRPKLRVSLVGGFYVPHYLDFNYIYDNDRIYSIGMKDYIKNYYDVIYDYDTLPDVLANLEVFGQRVEVWEAHPSKNGYIESKKIWTSQPAAQISISHMYETGWIDQNRYIRRYNSEGAFPIFGRSAINGYLKIDEFIPSLSYDFVN